MEIKLKKSYIIFCLVKNIFLFTICFVGTLSLYTNLIILILLIGIFASCLQNTVFLYKLSNKTICKIDFDGFYTNLTYDNLMVSWNDIDELSIVSESKKDTTIDDFHFFTIIRYTYIKIKTISGTMYYIPIHLYDLYSFKSNVTNYSVNKFKKTFNKYFYNKLEKFSINF